MKPLLGQIELLAFDHAPPGWARCDGALVPISRDMMLFTLIGTRFGGDGVNTFALPNMTGKEPIPHTAYVICTVGVFSPPP